MCSLDNRAYCYAELTYSSQVVPITMASTHCFSRSDGQAELALVAWLNTKMVYRCHRLSLPGGLSLPEAAITIAGANPNPEP